MAAKIPLRQWLSFLILLERRKHDAYTRDQNGEENNNFAKMKKAVQLGYIETAVSVALLLVQSLIMSTSPLAAQQIVIDNFTVVIDDASVAGLMENLDNENLHRIVESVTHLEFTVSINNEGFIPHVNGEQQRSDDNLLRALGTVLHQLFCRAMKPPIESITNLSSPDRGDSDEDHQDDGTEEPGAEKGRTKHSIRVAQKMLRKASISSLDEHLMSFGVPRNLCQLIVDLIGWEGGNEDTKIRSIEEVAEELIQIISKPNLFLYENTEEADNKGQLRFGNTLYGRRNESATFLRAATLVSLDTMETHAKQLILVEGLPGAGKSHFVESLITSSDFGWIYIHAKFDPQSQPLSVLTSAFNRFFARVLANRSEIEYVARVVSSLQRNLSSSAIVSLCGMLPSIQILFPSVLRRVVSDEDLSAQNGAVVDDEFASGSHMSRMRLNFLFRKLINAICSIERPLALFFDDLQWADDRCMEILSALMERDHLQELEDNDDTNNCLFIGSFRSYEANDNLLSYFDLIEQSPLVDVTKIQLGGLSIADSNFMISEALRLPTRLTSPLNELVQRKTTGNPFHIITFIQSLVKDSILSYSLSKHRWVWDVEAVISTPIDKTALDLLARKFSQLPDNTMDALKVLSCLGPKVDDALMTYLYTSPESRSEFIACLDLAVGEFILQKNGDDTYSFVHDMLKQLAYSVMSEEEKGKNHFWIGMQFIAHASADTNEFNAITFSTVDQINSANSFGVTEEALHIKFAELNLKAGRISLDVSDFQSALSYMKAGVSLLNGWQGGDYYDLSLQLHESAALVSYLNTDIELMKKYLTILFENANCFEDRLHGYIVMIKSLLGVQKQGDAMKKIIFILEGE